MATIYVVLRSDSGADLYQEIGTQEAGNDQAAITNFLAGTEAGVLRGETYGEGDYRAIPQRSWADKPREVKKKVSFG